jgi:hypothetical protein
MIRLGLILLALVVQVAAAPVVRDLGQGLTYVGVAALAEDLPAAGAVPAGACVLDLRGAVGSDADAAALSAWLKGRARPAAPVFVLGNSETAFALRLVLVDRTPGSGMMVVGVAGPGFEPDVAVKVAPEQERAALAALRRGARRWMNSCGKTAKNRNDEASLLRERPVDGEATNSTTAKAGTAAVIDVTLQRAVHVHRTLLALKRL